MLRQPVHTALDRYNLTFEKNLKAQNNTCRKKVKGIGLYIPRKILEGYYFSYLLLQSKPGQILVVQNNQAGFFCFVLFCFVLILLTLYMRNLVRV